MILLDTHVAVWLYAGEPERIAARARHLIEADDIAISPVVELELAYLHETGKVSVGPSEVISDLASRIGLSVSHVGFQTVFADATTLNWTRDPFDRLLAAHSLATQTPLITQTRLIRQHLQLAVWD